MEAISDLVIPKHNQDIGNHTTRPSYYSVDLESHNKSITQ